MVRFYIALCFAFIPLLLLCVISCKKVDEFKLGEQKFKKHDYASAAEHFSKSIIESPNGIEAYNYRSCCYFLLHEYDKSINDVNVIIKSTKYPYQYYYNRGLVNLGKGDRGNAINDFKISCGGSDDDLTNGYLKACSAFFYMQTGTDVLSAFRDTIPKEFNLLDYTDKPQPSQVVSDNLRPEETKLNKLLIAGDRSSIGNLAVFYAKAGYFEKAASLLFPMANTGDSMSQYNLGLIYQKAGDVPEAIKWWKKCSFEKTPNAAFNIGLAYFNGLGVVKDTKEAFKWYKVAAENGSGGAKFNVGMMYENGEGVDKNLELAMRWFEEAEKSNNQQVHERAYGEIRAINYRNLKKQLGIGSTDTRGF